MSAKTSRYRYYKKVCDKCGCEAPRYVDTRGLIGDNYRGIHPYDTQAACACGGDWCTVFVADPNMDARNANKEHG